jgi:hypothetical protein
MLWITSLVDILTTGARPAPGLEEPKENGTAPGFVRHLGRAQSTAPAPARGLELSGTVQAARTVARPKLKTRLFGRAFLRQDS